MNPELLEFYNILKESAPEFIGDTSPEDFVTKFSDRGKLISGLEILKQDYPDVMGGLTTEQALEKIHPISRKVTGYWPVGLEEPKLVNTVNQRVENAYEEAKPGLLEQKNSTRYGRNTESHGFGFASDLTDDEIRNFKQQAREKIVNELNIDPDQLTANELQDLLYPGKTAEANKKSDITKKYYNAQTDNGQDFRFSVINPALTFAHQGKLVYDSKSLTGDEVLAAESIPGVPQEELLNMKSFVTNSNKLRANAQLEALDTKRKYTDSQFDALPPELHDAISTLNEAQEAQKKGTLSKDPNDPFVQKALAAATYMDHMDSNLQKKYDSITNSYRNIESGANEIKTQYPELEVVKQFNQNLQTEKDINYAGKNWAGKAVLGLSGMVGEVIPRLGEGFASTYDAVLGGFGNENSQAREINRSLNYVPGGTSRDATVQQRPMLWAEKTGKVQLSDGNTYEVAVDDKGTPTQIYTSDGNIAVFEDKQKKKFLNEFEDKKGEIEVKRRLNGDAFFNTATDVSSDMIGTMALAMASGGAGVGARLREFVPIMLQYQGKLTEQALAQGLTPSQAAVKGTLDATLQAGTEMIFPNFAKINGREFTANTRLATRRFATENLGKLSKREFRSKFLKTLAEETGEEQLAYVFQPVIDKAFNNYSSNDVKESGVNMEGFLQTTGLAVGVSMLPALVGGMSHSRQVKNDPFTAETVFSIVSNIEDARKAFQDFNLPPDLLPVLEETAKRSRDFIGDERLPLNVQVESVAKIFDAEKRKLDARNAVGTNSEEKINKEAEELERKAKEPITPPIAPKTGEDKGKVFSDFDNTLWDNKTQSLTPLGEEMKARIAKGEDITILTARIDNEGAGKQFIADKLGISPDKVITGLDPAGKASYLTEGSTFYDDNPENVKAAQDKGGVNVVDTGSTAEKPGENTVPISSLERENGAIGTQGVNEDQVRGILENVLGLSVPEGATMREMVDLFKSNPANIQKLVDYTNNNPIDISTLPDGTVQVNDGHHRAFLLQQAGITDIAVKNKVDKVSNTGTNSTQGEEKVNQTETNPVYQQVNDQTNKINEGTSVFERFSQEEQSSLKEGNGLLAGASIIVRTNNGTGTDTEPNITTQEGQNTNAELDTQELTKLLETQTVDPFYREADFNYTMDPKYGQKWNTGKFSLNDIWELYLGAVSKKSRKQGAVVNKKILDFLEKRNPELLTLKYDRTDPRKVHDIVAGVASGLHINDIRYFVEGAVNDKTAIKNEKLSVKAKKVYNEAEGQQQGTHFVLSPETAQRIIDNNPYQVNEGVTEGVGEGVNPAETPPVTTETPVNDGVNPDVPPALQASEGTTGGVNDTGEGVPPPLNPEPTPLGAKSQLDAIQTTRGKDLVNMQSKDLLDNLGIPLTNPQDWTDLQMVVANVAIDGPKFVQAAKNIWGDNPINWIPNLTKYLETRDIETRNAVLTYLIYELTTTPATTSSAALLRGVEQQWRDAGRQASNALNSRRALRLLVEGHQDKLVENSGALDEYKNHIKALQELLDNTTDADLHMFESTGENANETVYEPVKPQKQRKGTEKADAKIKAPINSARKDSILATIREEQEAQKKRCR